MMRIQHSEEDGWERVTVNTQINSIHSSEEKMRQVKAFYLEDLRDAQKEEEGKKASL